VPEDLGIMLKLQEGSYSYNEVIVGFPEWEAGLPDIIEAFLGENNRDVHRRFLQKYGLKSAHVPLVLFKGIGNGFEDIS